MNENIHFSKANFDGFCLQNPGEQSISQIISRTWIDFRVKSKSIELSAKPCKTGTIE